MKLTLKRNYPLIILSVLVSLVLILGMGDMRIIAYTVPGKDYVQNAVNYTNDTGLFDSTLVHSIQIIMDEADYSTMITTYQETGEKDYFHADIIIDGVRINDVGIRLKGNASLRTALGRDGGRNWMQNRGDDQNRQPANPGAQPGQPGAETQPTQSVLDVQPGQPGVVPQGDQPPGNGENIPQNRPRPGAPQGGEMPAQPNQEQQSTPFPANPVSGEDQFAQQPDITNTSAVDTSKKVPFMIKFNEFNSEQTYQGYTNLAIRTYGTSADVSMLQEPVTNAMANLVGLPATKTAYTGFRINDNAEQLYTISEIIDENYLAQYFYNDEGILYKAEVGATLEYIGDDPSSYAEDFTQQSRVNDADMKPLIEFMQFLTEADDATFDSELDDYLDVDAFATYLAFNNLMVNLDSLAGMNNNYYLYYDDTTQRFVMLMWDANESLGKLGSGGGQQANYDIYYTNLQNNGMRNGMGGGTNLLLKRFLASDRYLSLYESKLQMIYQKVFANSSGDTNAITAQIEAHAALVNQANQERNLVDTTAYEQAVSKVLSFVAQRSQYLATTPLLSLVSLK